MNIKNIGQLLKVNDSQRSRLFEGSIINGKILSNDKGKGAIKLYDGTIIPAIFISDKTPDSDKNIKFIIQSFDGENFVVKVIGENEDAQNEKSLNSILRDLSIPFKEGKDIIMSLIKFNLPATNENINSIFKNINFLDNLKNMTDSEIQLFLKEYVDESLTQNSPEFVLTKNLISNLKNINLDFLSFMLENDIPHSLDNILKTQDFMNNKFLLNSFIDNVKNAVTTLGETINKSIADIQINNLDATSDKNITNIAEDNLNETANNTLISTNKSTINILTNNILAGLDKNNLDSLSQISMKIEILLSNSDNKESNLLSSISKDDKDVLLQLSKGLETLLSNNNNKVNNQLDPQIKNNINLLSRLDENIKTLLIAVDNNSPISEKENVSNLLPSSFEKDNTDILSQIDKNIKILLNDFSKNSKSLINSKVPQSEILSQIEKDINTLLSNKVSNISSKVPIVKETENQTAMHIERNLTESLKNTVNNESSKNSTVMDMYSEAGMKTKTEIKAETTTIPQLAKNIQTLLLTNEKNGNPTLLALNNNDKATLSRIYSKIETLLSNIDNETLSNINEDLNSILYNVDKSGDTLLSKFIKLASNKPMNSEKLIIDSVIQLLNNKTVTDKKNLVVASLEDTINIFKENKDMFSSISGNAYNKLLDNLDIFKQMNNNYNLYFFNLYDGNNIFKNNIIIKNKFKGSKFVDVNDVKAFISVDTKDIGTIEGNLYKKNNDISISFNVNEKFLTHFKNNLLLLKDELKKNGYDIVNLSVVKSNPEKNILPFSDFFNDSILKELDVKV